MRFGRGQAHPPARDEFGIGGFKSLGHAHHAIVPLRANAVADPVERREHPFRKSRRAFEHGVDDVARGTRFVPASTHRSNRVEQQALVANGGGEAHR